MTQAVQVVIVDDHPLFRAGVGRSLAELGIDVLGEGGSSDEALSLSVKHHPDVLLLDISMPGDGLSAISSIRREAPAVKIVMLTASENGEDLRKALQSGASGYALKGIGSRALAEVVRTVATGGCYIPPALSAKMLAQDSDHDTAESGISLTGREREVLDLIAVGLSNKVVARRLGLHEKTIKHHLTRIFMKLEVTNRTEAALKWQGSKQTGD